jgi:hypothetical protein
MFFYTNVFARGNKIYLRGYKDGRRHSDIIEYKPYLFVPSDNKTNTKHKTLSGKPVIRMDFDSISDARDFTKRYEDVANYDIYGLTNFQYLFIYDKFHGDMAYDTSQINVITIDIETNTGNKYTVKPEHKVKIRKKGRKI